MLNDSRYVWFPTLFECPRPPHDEARLRDARRKRAAAFPHPLRRAVPKAEITRIQRQSLAGAFVSISGETDGSTTCVCN
jgi:hypothetical protein